MKVQKRVLTMAHFPGLGNPVQQDLPFPFEGIFNKGVNLYKQGLEGVDAVVLWGGSDISPSLYGETPIAWSGPEHPTKRDVLEWETVREAVAKNILLIGVCRGAQLLCAYAGGSLIQHADGHDNGEHFIDTYNNAYFKVSSSHHQMMYPFKVKHELLAWSAKNLATTYQSGVAKPSPEKEPEVVWFPTIRGLAIQCHPEWHTTTHFNKWMFDEIEKRLCLC